MKLKYNNNIISLDKSQNSIIIDGEKIDLKISKIDDLKFKVTDGKDNFIATGIKDKDKFYISIEGRQYIFTEVEDEFSTKNQNEDRAEILPPMPGSVVKIIVNEGDSVNEGDPLIVVEAMKMETTLYSPINGIIKEIKVSEKEQVNPENYMILVEKKS